jgi:hypothetical protein
VEAEPLAMVSEEKKLLKKALKTKEATRRKRETMWEVEDTSLPPTSEAECTAPILEIEELTLRVSENETEGQISASGVEDTPPFVFASETTAEMPMLAVEDASLPASASDAETLVSEVEVTPLLALATELPTETEAPVFEEEAALPPAHASEAEVDATALEMKDASLSAMSTTEAEAAIPLSKSDTTPVPSISEPSDPSNKLPN